MNLFPSFLHQVSYALFLGLFTFMITNTPPKNPDALEWFLLVWVIAMAWEELMQVKMWFILKSIHKTYQLGFCEYYADYV